jgi:hypothetical protein
MKRFLIALLFVAACGGGTKNEPTGPATDPGQAEPAPAGACAPTGCSNTVCAEAGESIMTTCEWKDSYACYKDATCERQADGKCGWTDTPALQSCLASPPPAG